MAHCFLLEPPHKRVSLSPWLTQGLRASLEVQKSEGIAGAKILLQSSPVFVALKLALSVVYKLVLHRSGHGESLMTVYTS